MFAVLVLTLTLGMGTTVLLHARRSLRGEPYRARFLALGAGVLATVTVAVLAEDHRVLLAAWVASSVLAVGLLRTGPDAGRDARSRRAAATFLVGDVALAAGLLVLWQDASPTAAGLLVGVAAMSRAAVAPMHRWLPASLGAPTPSSALLHAGFVGSGPLLLIGLWPEVGGSMAVAAAIALAGALSCVAAEAVMLTRPDVKGRLAWSTIAQMSFTVLLCGLGLPLAALLHLVAHGMYKGSLFLGAGGSVRLLVRDREAPRSGRPVLRGPLAALVSRVVPGAAVVGGAALAGAVVAPGSISGQLAVPLALAIVAVGQAAAAALARTRTAAGAATVLAATSALGATYAAATVELKARLEPHLESVPSVLSPWWVLPVLGALLAVAGTRHLATTDGPVGRLWAAARRAGRPEPVVRTPRPQELRRQSGAGARRPAATPSPAHPTPARTEPALEAS